MRQGDGSGIWDGNGLWDGADSARHSADCSVLGRRAVLAGFFLVFPGFGQDTRNGSTDVRNHLAGPCYCSFGLSFWVRVSRAEEINGRDVFDPTHTLTINRATTHHCIPGFKVGNSINSKSVCPTFTWDLDSLKSVQLNTASQHPLFSSTS